MFLAKIINEVSVREVFETHFSQPNELRCLSQEISCGTFVCTYSERVQQPHLRVHCERLESKVNLIVNLTGKTFGTGHVTGQLDIVLSRPEIVSRVRLQCCDNTTSSMLLQGLTKSRKGQDLKWADSRRGRRNLTVSSSEPSMRSRMRYCSKQDSSFKNVSIQYKICAIFAASASSEAVSGKASLAN